jgi:hypothetical protein
MGRGTGIRIVDVASTVSIGIENVFGQVIVNISRGPYLERPSAMSRIREDWRFFRGQEELGLLCELCGWRVRVDQRWIRRNK